MEVLKLIINIVLRFLEIEALVRYI